MAKWKLSTVEKKSITDVWVFTHMSGSDKWAKVQEHWRWGYAVVESKTKPKFAANQKGFDIYSEYDVSDTEVEDGVSTWFEYSDVVTDEERADFENAYHEGLEEVNNLGWLDEDNSRIFHGKIAVEKY